MKKRVSLAALAAVMTAGAVMAPIASAKALPNVGCAIYKYDDTFMTSVRNSILKAAPGVANVEMVDSQNSQPAQNDKIDLFITKKVKAMMINPVDITSAKTTITKAKAANIPVVFFNREPGKTDMKLWNKAYYVGANPAESGKMQGQIMAAYWKKNKAKMDKNKDGVLDYVMLTGEPGHPDAIARTKYSIQELKDEGIKVKCVAQDTGMWDRVKGQDKMASMLAANGNKIEAVFANNDDMALGAIEALKASGYFKGGKYMPVVGVDATAVGLKALKDGTLLGTVLNDAANQGKATLKLAALLAQGKKPTSANLGYKLNGQYVYVPYKKITK